MKTMLRSLSHRQQCVYREAAATAYTSRFSTASWPLGVALCALNVSRRLTGSRLEPGILVLECQNAPWI